MATLKGLVQKGVKVDLGIPLELWDEPSVEVTFLKKQVGLDIALPRAMRKEPDGRPRFLGDPPEHREGGRVRTLSLTEHYYRSNNGG